jgi:dipeptide/tripeptide permease
MNEGPSMMLIGVAVGAVVSLSSAVVGALIGTSKGRPVSGAFSGLLLGPIGWLIFTRIGFVIEGIVAVIAGFVAANVIMIAIEFMNVLLYPDLVKALESKDPEAIKEAIASASVGAMLVVIVAWACGSLAGGYVAAWIGRNGPVVHALVVGAFLTCGGIANNLTYPPPVWFWIVTFVVFFLATYVGARLAPKRIPESTTSAGASA